MAAVQKRTINLPPAQASYLDALVDSGTYASASEVVRTGLLALQERDGAIERWLRNEVIPVYDATIADPARAIPAKDVLIALHAHHAGHLKASISFEISAVNAVCPIV